jgi:outer membrane protein
VFGCPLWSVAQGPAEVLTLDAAIARAVDANRGARIAELDEAHASDAIAAIRTERLPKFDLKALTGGVLTPLAFSFSQGAFGTFPATGPIPFADLSVDSPRGLGAGVFFTAIQPLTQLRSVAVGERLMALGRDIAAEKRRAVRLAVVADVKRAYYGLRQVHAGLTAFGEAEKQLEELDRVVRGYVEQELALPADHLAVRTERARVEQSVLGLRNTEATLKERINLLLGRDLATPFAITDEFPAAPESYELGAIVDRAKAARPAVREAALNVERALQDARLTERQRWPDIGVGFSFVRLLNVEVLPQTFAAAGVVGSWEPFDWGRRGIERAGKARTIEQARLGLQEAEALVTLDVHVRFRAVHEAESALKLAGLTRDTAVERLRVVTDQYAVEAILLKDVLEAQTALARATSEYQQAIAAFWTARADLEEAVGDDG